MEEIGRRASNSEVIVIIRPHDATGRSEVIKLNAASPGFVETLEAAARSGATAPNVALQSTGVLTR
jgi:hypothetical protein